MEPAAFEIIETPALKFTLRWAEGQETFGSMEEALKAMTLVITPKIHSYNAIGTLLEK